jgi:hypothetical protein
MPGLPMGCVPYRALINVGELGCECGDLAPLSIPDVSIGLVLSSLLLSISPIGDDRWGAIVGCTYCQLVIRQDPQHGFLTLLGRSSALDSGALEAPESSGEGILTLEPGPPHENVRWEVGLSVLVRSVPPPTAYEGCHCAEWYTTWGVISSSSSSGPASSSSVRSSCRSLAWYLMEPTCVSFLADDRSGLVAWFNSFSASSCSQIWQCG